MKKIMTMVNFARRFSRKVNRDRVRAHAAEAAFFIIVSFFPILMLFLLLLQFTPLNQQQLLAALESATPFELTDILKPIIDSLFNRSTALLSWTALAALWTAGKGIMGLADGLNSIYQITETKNYFWVRIRSACYTFVMILALILSLGILVFGYTIQEFLWKTFPVMQRIPESIMILPMALAMVILVLLFLVLYSFLPNRRMKLAGQLPGSIFTTVAWTIFSYAFSIYLEYAGNMSVIYGSLTTLVVIMLWLYFCMYLLFIGAELNEYIAHPERF